MSNIPHVPTEKNRATVGMMVLAGVDRDTIAAALKITKPTLSIVNKLLENLLTAFKKGYLHNANSLTKL